jgi:hypothetical protein
LTAFTNVRLLPRPSAIESLSPIILKVIMRHNSFPTSSHPYVLISYVSLVVSLRKFDRVLAPLENDTAGSRRIREPSGTRLKAWTELLFWK